MIPVMIETLVVGSMPSPSVVVLRPFAEDNSNGRVLPIWIGPTEAASIGIALEGAPHPRPMTHDLIDSMLSALSVTLDHIIINRVEGTTFYATLVLKQGDEFTKVDARPSDSIALAVRTHAPIYVDEAVMEVASFPYVFGPGSDKQSEIEAFHEFIDSVSPEDFKV